MLQRMRGLLFLLVFALLLGSTFAHLEAGTVSLPTLPIVPPGPTLPSLPASWPLSITSGEGNALPNVLGAILRSSSEPTLPSHRAYIGEQQLLVFEQRYTVRNNHNTAAKEVELKLQLLPEHLPGYQVIFEERIWPEVSRIETDAVGNRFAYVRCSSLAPNEEMIVTVAYNLSSSSWEIDKAMLTEYSAPVSDPAILAALHPLDEVEEKFIESSHPEIVAAAYSIVGDETNPYHKAELLYSWVNARMTYDEDERYAHRGSYAALQSLRGVCTENASLLVALLRAAEIPARIVGGYLFTPVAKADHGMPLNGDQMAHTWVEFYLEGFGWVPCEPTYELIENGVRRAALKHFAVMPQWGHIATGYGLNGGSKVSYIGNSLEMMHTEVITTFQYGQRLMDDETKIYLSDWDSRIAFADQQPMLLDNGVTMVPMRRIFELLGASVSWDAESNTIIARRDDRLVELRMNQPVLWVGGNPINLLVPPFINEENGRTLVPLRAISEGLGARVNWDALRRRIQIVPADES